MNRENERELLELAAKAAGYIVMRHTEGAGVYVSRDNAVTRFLWNPAYDSGQGAELESVLDLEVTRYAKSVAVGKYSYRMKDEFYASHAGDKQAARRWATVRAAAEIGRTL